MKHFRRLLTGALCACLLLDLLSGCAKKQEAPVDDGVTSVYATFYPLYAAADLIANDVPGTSLNCLVQPQDGCLRDYQLSDWDLALLGSSDVVLAGGRGLESFESLLYTLGENGPAVSALLYNMDLLEQRAVNTQADAQSHWLDSNPHIYMQTDGMLEIVRRTANSLALINEANKDAYLANLAETETKLSRLADEIAAALAEFKGEKVIVLNEALVYAAQEYGLDTALCYERESGEELFDSDLDACLNALGKSGAKVVLIEKQAPQAFCEALEEAGYFLARMDILSTRRANEGSDGYFSAQRANAQAVKAAFTEANSASNQ